jgi:hypothetical protein
LSGCAREVVANVVVRKINTIIEGVRMIVIRPRAEVWT